MADKARLLRLDDQPPLIQLIAAFFLVVLAGTILFYLFIFAGSLIFDTGTSEMLLFPPAASGSKATSILKYVQSSQQISLFLIPSLIIASLLKRGNESFMGMDRAPGNVPAILVILLAFLIIPVTSYTGAMNAGMELPPWMSGIEKRIRILEDEASEMTRLLITSDNVGVLGLNLIIMALIPSFGEELLFRGVFQQLFSRFFRSAHIGIWITAILFSTIHFQFFGFVPRLILGLMFGYLFFWSKNLWTAVIAHFVNNSVPVVMSLFSGWRPLKESIANYGEGGLAFPFIPLILSVMTLYFFRHVSITRRMSENIQ